MTGFMAEENEEKLHTENDVNETVDDGAEETREEAYSVIVVAWYMM